MAKSKIYLPFGGTVKKKRVLIQPYIYPSVIICLLVLLGLFFVMKYTKFGRSIYAVGGNEQSALLMGLNETNQIKSICTQWLSCSLSWLCICLNTTGGFNRAGKRI